MLAQHAGAARWAFNYALGRKVAAQQAFTAARAQMLTDTDVPTAEQVAAATAAARLLVGRMPGSVDNLKTWRAERGDDRAGVAGVSPWWHTVSSYAISSGMRDADAAFQAWFDSLAGRRAGRAAGYPRFKRKGRSQDSFTLLPRREEADHPGRRCPPRAAAPNRDRASALQPAPTDPAPGSR